MQNCLLNGEPNGTVWVLVVTTEPSIIAIGSRSRRCSVPTNQTRHRPSTTELVVLRRRITEQQQPVIQASLKHILMEGTEMQEPQLELCTRNIVVECNPPHQQCGATHSSQQNPNYFFSALHMC